MAEIKTNTLSLLVNGQTVEIKKPSKQNFELNKELLTEQGFSSFTQDPAAFTKKYDLVIDQALSDQLKAKLQGVKSVKELQELSASNRKATAWAVAAGSYSIASSKIAVAF